MDGFLLVFFAGLILLAIYHPLLPAAARTYARFREPEALPCPETGRLTAVRYAALRAGLGTLFFGRPAPRIVDCGNWPVKGGCNQMCLTHVR